VQTAYGVMQCSMRGAMAVAGCKPLTVSCNAQCTAQWPLLWAMRLLHGATTERLTYGGLEYIDSIESQIVTVY
jgi:hypothetical protein